MQTVLATKPRKRKKVIDKINEANQILDDLFYDSQTQEYTISQRIIDLMKNSIELIANGIIKSASIKINNNLSSSITLDGKGSIKINRKKVYSETISGIE